jgi:hypothetical protein
MFFEYVEVYALVDHYRDIPPSGRGDYFAVRRHSLSETID